MQPICLIATVSLGAACQTTASGDEDACSASLYQSLVGQQLSTLTLPAKREMRVIEPGMAVTLDHVSSRLNIRLGEDGRFAAVTCG